MSPLYTNWQFIDCQRKRCISSKSILFQLAQGGIESAVYKKLIAPFKNDLPTSASDGFRRVCADHKYAFFGSDFSKNFYSLSLPCQLVPLPETSFKFQWAFVISKNSTYRGLINWRWDNKMNSITYMTDKSRLCVPRKSANTYGHVCILLDIRALPTGM